MDGLERASVPPPPVQGNGYEAGAEEQPASDIAPLTADVSTLASEHGLSSTPAVSIEGGVDLDAIVRHVTGVDLRASNNASTSTFHTPAQPGLPPSPRYSTATAAPYPASLAAAAAALGGSDWARGWMGDKTWRHYT